MTTFALIHGAFRGGWSWDFVVERLLAAGHEVVAPTLTGCESDSGRVGTVVHLDEWTQDVIAAIESTSAERVVLVGHSQGGVVAKAVASVRPDLVERMVMIEAPVPADGDLAIDLNPPTIPPPPPGLDPALWVPASPVTADQGFNDEALAAWVNARLVPTPLGPSLDASPVSPDALWDDIPWVFAFGSETPPMYPCWSTRLHLDAAGWAYEVLQGSFHDPPLTHPDAVASLLLTAVGVPPGRQTVKGSAA